MELEEYLRKKKIIIEDLLEKGFITDKTRLQLETKMELLREIEIIVLNK